MLKLTGWRIQTVRMQAIHINLNGCFHSLNFLISPLLSRFTRGKNNFTFIPFPCHISSTSLKNTNKKGISEESKALWWWNDVAISLLFLFIICLFRKFVQTFSSGEIMFSSFSLFYFRRTREITRITSEKKDEYL